MAALRVMAPTEPHPVRLRLSVREGRRRRQAPAGKRNVGRRPRRDRARQRHRAVAAAWSVVMAAAGTRRFLPSVVGLSSIVLIFAVVEILIRVGLINRFIVPLPSDVAEVLAASSSKKIFSTASCSPAGSAWPRACCSPCSASPSACCCIACRCCAAPARPGSRPWRRRRWCWPIRCSWCCSAAAR